MKPISVPLKKLSRVQISPIAARSNDSCSISSPEFRFNSLLSTYTMQIHLYGAYLWYIESFNVKMRTGTQADGHRF